MTSHIVAADIRQAFEQVRDMDASMGERLKAFADAIRNLHPSAAAIADRIVNRLKEHGAGDAAPKVGDLMPPFILPDESGRLVSLQEMLANGPVIATFHRGHWCPYCRISINALAEAQEKIKNLGAHMVAIIPERGQFAAEMKLDSNVRFPILTDMDNGYALMLNLTFWVGTEVQQFMTSLGRDLPEYQGNESWMLPIPATFVVGKDGRIKARFVDPDYRKRMAIEELIGCLKQ